MSRPFRTLTEGSPSDRPLLVVVELAPWRKIFRQYVLMQILRQGSPRAPVGHFEGSAVAPVPVREGDVLRFSIASTLGGGSFPGADVTVPPATLADGHYVVEVDVVWRGVLRRAVAVIHERPGPAATGPLP